MKVVVPVTIDDSNMASDAVDEIYPEWGTTKRLVEYQMPNTTLTPVWHIWENPATLDVYIAGNRTIYKQVGGAGEFSQFALLMAGYSAMDISGNHDAGFLYCVSKLSSSYYQIFAFDLESGTMSPYSVAEPSGVIRSIAPDLSTGNVYYATDSGIKVTNSTLETTPTVHDATYTNVRAIRIRAKSNTLYAYIQGAPTNGVYYQSGLSGSITLLGALSYGERIAVSEESGNIYVMTTGSDIYLDEGGAGSPALVTEYDPGTSYAIAISNRFEGIYISGASIRVASPSEFFLSGEYCISGTRVYVSLVENNTAETSDSTKWFRYSAVNRLNMFDGASSTPTTGVGELNLTIDNSNMTAMGFFGVVAESITVTLTVDAVEVFSETKTLRNTEISDWYDYFFEPINQIRTVVFTDIPAYTTGVFSVTISGSGETDPVECALCVAGFSYDIGRTKRNVRPRIVSYSTQTIDSFGRVTFVRRNSAKRIEGDAFVEDRSDFERVFSLMDQIRDTPCMWIVSRDFDAWSILYGLHQKFEPVVTNNNGTYSFELLEVFG